MTMLPNYLYNIALTLFAMSAFRARLHAEESYIGSCCPLYGSCTNVFTNKPQTILPGQSVAMEGINVQTEDTDCCITDLNGFVSFTKPGFYKICWSVEGRSHLPTADLWSFGLILDNAIVPGSVHGNFRSDASSQKVGGGVIFFIETGQILSLINTSSNIVNLIAQDENSAEPLCPATLSISLVKR